MIARTTRWCALVALVILLAIAGNEALAKKPVKPPPPPPDPGDVGTIYFDVGLEVYEMAGDGSGKSWIPLGPLDWAWEIGPASGARHGGERWFLVYKQVGNETLPNWNPRCELHAVSEAGVEVRLCADSDYQPSAPPGGYPQWAVSAGVVDGKVSHACMHWVQDPVTEEWYVDEWGIYVAELDPADLADGEPLDLTWTRLPLEFPLIVQDEPSWGFKCRYHWSPDGTNLVYDDSGFDAPGNIYVAEHGTPIWSKTLLAWGTAPRWSPDGTRIAYTAPTGIETMDANGSAVTTVVSDPEDKNMLRKFLLAPYWSPSGTHLIYKYLERDDRKRVLKVSELYRVAVDGTGAVNLTADVETKIGWIHGWPDE